ncbi:MAG TPA: ABC transporter permease [Defluviitoga sp.]|nr:ABC transporter permease [Defluviitoga sp.]HOP24776.1 ABC transporter permease [Defluviitoga sp.]HPZ29604.1 ABC transporter permease [Defluviitoga sp.]HQD63395.1 ABC transporter permease [Defluviitoga sp.]
MKGFTKYFVQKLLWYALAFFIALLLNFFLPRLIPGDPISVIVGQMMSGNVPSETQERVYRSFVEEFGLDKPLIVQFFTYIGNVFKGNLGTSFSLYPLSVNEVISSAVVWTIALQLPSILVGWIVGNLLGAAAAYRKGVFDKTIFPLSLFVSSIPYQCLAIILLYVFGVNLGWFPIGGGYSRTLLPTLSWTFILDVLHHYFLPFLSLVLVTIGGQAIGMREMSIYELNTDYVTYCKMLGMSDKKIQRYVFKNAVLPQITGLAISLGSMVGGALVTEIVFGYPGLGTWLFNGIRSLDYPLIQGSTLIIALMVLLANFIMDMVYGLIDPRVKAAQMEEV